MDHAADAEDESEFASARRQSWARLLRKVLEACPPKPWRRRGLSAIAPQARRRIDSILRHVEEGGGHDPHAPRAPPAA